MTMREYLFDRLGVIVLQAVLTVATAGFLRATGTGIGVILLLVIFWLLAFLWIYVTGFHKCRDRLKELEKILDGLDEKYLFAESIPGGGSVYERRLTELFRRAGRTLIGAVSDARTAQQEYREYMESLVHEIKTPVAAAGLICHNADSETCRMLSPELAQIEAHVERAQFYVRAESPEKDFTLRRVRLSEIVDTALERHRALLIQSGIVLDVRADGDSMAGMKKERIELENALSRLFKVHMEEDDSDTDMEAELDHIVCTDDKWVVFILGQLLQNAARYRKEYSGGDAAEENIPTITIWARQLGRQEQLIISDNGIGIPEDELPRVFDRGFTGSNGRVRGSSTGMGLYLCRRLAECLKMGLQIASEEGQGTTVTLTFPASEKR